MVRTRQTRQGEKKKQSFDVTACISRVISEIIRPDFSEVIREIDSHEFVYMKLSMPESGEGPVWGKVLFALEGCAIVQEVERTWNVTRFKTYKISYGTEWDSKFVGWVDPGHERYEDVLMCWEEGADMYTE